MVTKTHITLYYRDVYVRDHLNKLRETKPVIFCGDLNVAHTDLDVYNFQAKHLLKQAGTTLREKESFSTLLKSGFQDALRYIYPGNERSNSMNHFSPDNAV